MLSSSVAADADTDADANRVTVFVLVVADANAADTATVGSRLHTVIADISDADAGDDNLLFVRGRLWMQILCRLPCLLLHLSLI